MGFMPVADHPLRLFLDEGLLASVCTDDPLMFGPFSVSDTLNVIGGPLGLDDAILLQLCRNGIQSAFVSEARRRILMGRLEDAARDAHAIRPARPDNAAAHP
jgi:adenosine deaminase